MICEVCLYRKENRQSLTLNLFDIPEGKDLINLLGFEPVLVQENIEGVRIKVRNVEELNKAKDALGEYVFSEGESMEEVVGRLLKESGKTLSTAESCTAGLLSARIVNIPGSSEYFLGGVVVYSNELKRALLGVKEETLKTFGAVSRETCVEMLNGLKQKFRTDTGIAITGIAGPGGSENKPEGLTYIGVYIGERVILEERIFKRGRNSNRFLSTQVALNILRKELLKEMS